MRSPLGEALAALAKALRKLGVRWYLFGAQAALLYGAARFTADVDVTVRTGSRAAGNLVGALEQAGFRVRIRDVDEFVARTRVLPFTHVRSGLPLDVVLAGPGLEEIFFTRLKRRVVEGVRVPVASPEDIVIMKLLAGRGKDEDDMLAIIAAQHKLDLKRVRETVEMLERALDRHDLRPQFERLLARARRPISRRRRHPT